MWKILEQAFSCSAFKHWVLLEKGLFQFNCVNVPRISELKEVPAIFTQYQFSYWELKETIMARAIHSTLVIYIKMISINQKKTLKSI